MLSNKILMIDDEPLNLKITAMLLKGIQSAGIITATSGPEGLEKARSEKPDLILLDIMMPGMDGFEFLRQQHNDPICKDIPVIVISSIDDMDSIVRCIEFGAVDYLVKPFNATLLKARIDTTLDKKYALDRERKLHNELSESLVALKKAEEMRDFLVHTIVHDLNNYLSGLAGMVDVAKMTPDAFISNLPLIENSITKMTGMIQLMLEVSKLESGTFSATLESSDIIPLIRNEIVPLRTVARKSEISIIEKFTCNKVCCMVDHNLFGRILQNLLGNALKYAPQNSVVSVSVMVDKKDVVVSISDTGKGIPDIYKEKIFEKFFQVEERKSNLKFGVGMGLAFCRLAIKAMNGRIWIEDNVPIGTIMKFAVPVQYAIQ
jgi:two-component system, sensor histidine kinase and response regulator